LLQRFISRQLAKKRGKGGRPLFPLVFPDDDVLLASTARARQSDPSAAAAVAAQMVAQQTLLDKTKEAVNAFGLVFDSAPPLPRPLPGGAGQFDRITIQGTLHLAAVTAPLPEQGEKAVAGLPTALRTRLLKALLGLYRKSHQMADAHALISSRNDSQVSTVQIGCLLLGTAITIILIEAPDWRVSTLAAAVGAAVISAATSFTKLIGFETKVAQHRMASAAFRDCANDVERLFSALATSANDSARDQQGANAAAGEAAGAAAGAATAAAATVASRAVAEAPSDAQLPPRSAGVCEHATPLTVDGTRGNSATGQDAAAVPGAAPASAAGTIGAPALSDRSARAALCVPGFTITPVATAETRLDTQMRLQTWLRKAGEYRMAHSTVATACAERGSLAAFAQLLASNAVSIMLLLGPDLAAVAAVASALISAFAGFVRFFDFNSRAASHSQASRTFAAIERDLMMMITTGSAAEQRSAFDSIGDRFSLAEANAPDLPDDVTDDKDDDTDELLYPNITPAARRLEVQHIAEAVVATA